MVDLYFLISCIYIWFNFPDAQTDKTGRKEKPLLINFTLSVLGPETIAKAILLMKACSYRP